MNLHLSSGTIGAVARLWSAASLWRHLRRRRSVLGG
jgi:uncharacterized protein YjiS (DUF1127 family)